MYRYIVEKYAGYNALDSNGQISQNITIICDLAVFLDGFWDQFKESKDQNDNDNRERQILLSAIMRIMS